MKYLLALSIILSGCSAIQKKEEEAPRVTPPHLVGWSYECHKLESVEGGSYCIHTKGTPKYTIPYFHGLGCNQDVLQDPTGVCKVLPGMKKKDGSSERALMTALDNVTVVTVSFGEAWMMDPFPPKLQADKDATTKNFAEKIFPEIERRHPGRLPKPWKAVGHSMGGHNLVTLAMSYPEMFSLVALIRPMIVTCDPWQAVVGLKCVGGILFIGAEFPREKWLKATPLARIKKERLPLTFVDVCWDDEFGLVDGPKEFAMTGMGRGLQVYLRETTAGCTHSEFDAPWVLQVME